MSCSELAAGYHPLACQYGMYLSVLFCASWGSSYRLQHRTQLCWAHGARTSCGVVGREEPEEGDFIATHPGINPTPNITFRWMLSYLMLQLRRKPSRVHCVGHAAGTHTESRKMERLAGALAPQDYGLQVIAYSL